MGAVFENDWGEYLYPEFEKPYYKDLRKKLAAEYRTRKVYPDMYDIFNAFHYTSYADMRVVIIGQDPYHDEGQAHGLCFSVRDGTALPPSLVNIYKELQDDLGIPPAKTGDLTPWARQGVLLLNSVLTVRAHQAASHRFLGWETFTDRVISIANEKTTPVAFILWGAFAQSKASLITEERHLIIKSAHPSPLSAHRGFFGSRPFSRVNDFLLSTGQKPIDWRIE
ncbi:MAG: uracil-DNA glycosylase [Eubacteriaceae bacterium]|nr:uracil-DNA glycosylase [Eubacteriaceae bacterium]